MVSSTRTTYSRHYVTEVDKVWEACKDHALFVQALFVSPYHLVARPKWIKGGQPPKVGSILEYTISVGGTQVLVHDTITKLGETGSGYILEWTQARPDLNQPASSPAPIDGTYTWEIITKTVKHGQRTRVLWTHVANPSYFLGLFRRADPLGEAFKSNGPNLLTAFGGYLTQIYPKRLPGLKDRIVIVGAGPSGLHMAHLLKQRGYENITIMEKESRWGGKTYTIQEGKSEGFEKQLVGIDTLPTPDTVYHELGTCYLHPAYNAVRDLFKELRNLGATQSFEEVGPESYAIYREGLGELGLEDWVTSTIQVQPTFSPFNLIRILFPFEDAAVEILLAKAKYNTLHESIFGKYNYSMPPPLTTEAMHLLDMSFGEFLKKHNLSVLLPLVAYGTTCQGYGSIPETPAFWVMCWITPDLLNGLLRDFPRLKTMLKQGWISLWNAIVQVNNLKIRFNTSIEKIERTQEGRVIITGTQGERIHEKFSPDVKPGKFQEEFDFLIMAAPVVAGNGDTVLDLTDEERDIFTKNVEHGQFRTVLFKPREPQPNLKSHLGLSANRIIGSAVGEGEVFAWRDSYLALHPARCFDEDDKFPDSVTRPEDGIYHQNDPKRDERREQMAYQYVENNKNYSEEFLHEKFGTWAHSHFGDQYELLHEKTWDYFTRFNSFGIRQRQPWRLLTIQGTNKTLFVHASTFCESVLDIVNYNNMLLDGLSGRFNQLVPAKRITPPKPTQAPKRQDLVPEPQVRKKNFGGWFLTAATETASWLWSTIPNVTFAILTPVLNTAWTLTYALGYPLFRGVIFPIQRYSIQAAFKTQNISPFSWWSINYFIRVSPSVICLETGEEDPVVTRLYSQVDLPIATQFPGIQRPHFALNWNYQDYRVMIGEWLRVIQPTYLSFIGPRLAKWIRLFASWFPQTYGFVFSWIAVLNFAYLTGYSYRKHDAKGGACYVPKCEMLAESKKQFGEEQGSRICTHVCKVFTEEFLRTKGIDATFMPNFANGSCTIVGRAKPSNCFSDNVLYEW